MAIGADIPLSVLHTHVLQHALSDHKAALKLSMALGKPYLKEFLANNHRVSVGDIVLTTFKFEHRTDQLPFDYHVNWGRVIRVTKGWFDVQGTIDDVRIKDEAAGLLTTKLDPATLGQIFNTSTLRYKPVVKRIKTKTLMDNVYVSTKSYGVVTVESFWNKPLEITVPVEY